MPSETTTGASKHVTVCVCTFRRPALLERLLDQLDSQQTGKEFAYSIVVADNDASLSAKEIVTRFAETSRTHTDYTSEPRRNIALARNKAIERAKGSFIAFLDDDEIPEPDWLLTMLRTCEELQAAGVLGPVRPRFDGSPPRWIVDGGFCERPEHPTGRVMKWEECRTGNVLLRRGILDGVDEPFNPLFGSGGEDKDFFMRMMARGHVFRWCNEGVVHESVPPARWTRRYLMRRALLRGRNILKHPVGRAPLLARSVIAVPTYLAILPVAIFLGQRVFMKNCIRMCDHAGRLLALVGMNPVRERDVN